MNYFTIAEMTRSDTAKKYGIDNTPTKEIERNLRVFIEVILDPLRESWGSAVTVSSGYRCPRLNRLVGGAENSGHQYGFCADLRVKGDIRTFAEFVYGWMTENNMKFDEMIFETSGGVTWLHLSWIGKGGRQRMRRFNLTK